MNRVVIIVEHSTLDLGSLPQRASLWRFDDKSWIFTFAQIDRRGLYVVPSRCDFQGIVRIGSRFVPASARKCVVPGAAAYQMPKAREGVSIRHRQR
jgi:hypothetical protein